VRENFVDDLCKAMDEVYPSSYANDGLSGGGRGRGDVEKMVLLQHAERVFTLIDSKCEVFLRERTVK